MLKKPSLQTVILLLSGSLVFIGAILVASGFLTFEWAHVQADALSPDGDASVFTVAFFKRVQIQLQGMGVIVALLGGVIGVFRKPLSVRARREYEAFQNDFRRFRKAVKSTIFQSYQSLSHWHWFSLGILLLSSAGLRLFFIQQPLSSDEATSYIGYASSPIYVGLSAYSYPNNHLFHTLLLKGSTFLFGDSLWSIRLPVFIAGVFLVLSGYLMAFAFYGPSAGLWAGALLGRLHT